MESISNYSRLMEMFHRAQSHHARQREIDLGLGGEINEFGQSRVDRIPRDEVKTVTMPLLSGLLGGNTKYIWLSASPVVIEIELADPTAGLMTGKGGRAEKGLHGELVPAIGDVAVDLSLSDLEYDRAQPPERGRRKGVPRESDECFLKARTSFG